MSMFYSFFEIFYLPHRVNTEWERNTYYLDRKLLSHFHLADYKPIIAEFLMVVTCADAERNLISS